MRRGGVALPATRQTASLMHHLAVTPDRREDNIMRTKMSLRRQFFVSERQNKGGHCGAARGDGGGGFEAPNVKQIRQSQDLCSSLSNFARR